MINVNELIGKLVVGSKTYTLGTVPGVEARPKNYQKARVYYKERLS